MKHRMPTHQRQRFPATAAFDADNEIALWIWMYRVWNGWKWPGAHLPWLMRAVPS